MRNAFERRDVNKSSRSKISLRHQRCESERAECSRAKPRRALDQPGRYANRRRDDNKMERHDVARKRRGKCEIDGGGIERIRLQLPDSGKPDQRQEC